MPKNPSLLDYLNNFNYIYIEDVGENYNIKMYSIIGKKEGEPKFRKLDGTVTENEVYWVLVPKIVKQILY